MLPHLAEIRVEEKMSEISDACQVVMISGRVIATTGQLSLKLALLMMKIYNTLYLGKWKGVTSFQRFRAIKGDDFEFINICTEDPQTLFQIEKEMEAHNLLCSRLPDLCGGDGNTQYVISSSDMKIFEAFLKDHNHGTYREVKVGPIEESDYAKTAVHPESGEYTKEFKDLTKDAKEQYEIIPRIEMKEKDTPHLLPLHHAMKKELPSEMLDIDVMNDPKTLMITHYGIREDIKMQDLFKDPQLRLYNELSRDSENITLLYEKPIRMDEKWAAFPIHDGEKIVVVPKDDLLAGNTTREKTYLAIPQEKMPYAMLFSGKEYVTVDMKSGEKSILRGRDLSGYFKMGGLSKRKEALTNMAKNIEKNIGAGAIMPNQQRHRSGR